MAGYDQYKSTTQLEYGPGSQRVGPNKGVFISLIGSTADGAHQAAGGSAFAGITFTAVGSAAGSSFGIHGMCDGQTGAANLPYILPIAIRSYSSHNFDNKIYLLQ